MSVHLSTILTRSPTNLTTAISHLAERYPGYPLLFALSPNFASEDVSRVVNRLTSFSSHTAGCLSAPLLSSKDSSLIACSLAVLDPNRAVLFRSNIPGRPPPQVGRWHGFRNRNDIPEAAHYETQLEGLSRGVGLWNESDRKVSLPENLRSFRPEDVGEVIYFSDLAQEGLSSALTAFPNTTKLGLIASSTPFITGRPVTLFHRGDVYGHGAVGFAFKQKQGTRSRAKLSIEFVGLIPLSEPMAITRAEGNVVISIDNSNPTQLLLSALHRNGVHSVSPGWIKDHEEFLLGTLKDGELTRLHKITAGDPVRGSISLESQVAPIIGTEVQFFRRSQEYNPMLHSQKPVPETHALHALRFMTSPESPPANVNTSTAVQGTQFLRNFSVASENGFIMSEPNEVVAWTCSVLGASVTLRWPTG